MEIVSPWDNSVIVDDNSLLLFECKFSLIYLCMNSRILNKVPFAEVGKTVDEAYFWGTSGRLVLDLLNLKCLLDINVKMSMYLGTMNLEFRAEVRRRVTSLKSSVSK